MAAYRYPTSIRLSTAFKRKLRTLATARGQTVAQMVVWVLERWVARQERGHGGTQTQDEAPAQKVQAQSEN